MTNSSTRWDRLLLVSLGPVQDFIAAARRCQDLWYGSWLLSSLSRAVADSLAEECGSESLVFPGTVSERDAAVANKIMTLVPVGLSTAQIADKANRALGVRLRQLRDEAFQRIDSSNLWRKSEALLQIDDLVEWNWVCVSLTGGDLAASRRAAEQLLAARKNTRTWTSVSWRLAGERKSSVDGLRESVLKQELYTTKRGQRARFGVRNDERLCGVSLLKRRGQDLGSDDPASESAPAEQAVALTDGLHASRPAFHSTTHLAVAPLLTRLARLGRVGESSLTRYWNSLRAHLGDGIRRYRIRPGVLATAKAANPWAPEESIEWNRTLLQSGNGDAGFDAYPLVEDRLSDILAEASSLVGENLLRAEADLRGDLRQCLSGLGVSSPNAYYAILVADGDHVGRAIDAIGSSEGGDSSAKVSVEATLSRYRALSVSLDAFAHRATEIVAQAGGSLVFAGGDDVLAFIPLHTALQCARELRDEFRATMKPLFETQAASGTVMMPTLSVGLAIVHHLEPLADARRIAYEAERLAKLQRNSLGIIAQKRQGARYEVSAEWTDDESSLDRRVSRWITRLHREDLPDAAAFELGRISRFMDALRDKDDISAPIERRDLADPPAASSAEVTLALATRALTRRRGGRGTAPLDSTMRDELLGRAKAAQDATTSVREIADEIKIARIMLTAWEHAWGALPTASTEVPT